MQTGGPFHHHHDDGITRRILRILRERRKATTPGKERPLISEDEDLALAFHLHETGRPQTRWLLEARLLAGEDPAQIATKLGVSEFVIERYADTFFDVTQRLSYRDFILPRGDRKAAAPR